MKRSTKQPFMDIISRRRQGNEQFQFGGFRLASLLLTDDVAVLGLSGCVLQLSQDLQPSVKRPRISTSKSETRVFSFKRLLSPSWG